MKIIKRIIFTAIVLLSVQLVAAQMVGTPYIIDDGCSTLLTGDAGSAQTICYNTAPAQLTGGTASGGIGTFTYQWQSSADNTTWTDISGATAANYTPAALTANTYFRRTVTSGTCIAYSNSVLMTVRANLVAGTASAAQTLCYNTRPAQLTGGAASGGTGTYTYQWQSSTNNSTWTNISGATAASYRPDTLTASTYYRRVVTSETCGTVYGNSVPITVLAQVLVPTIIRNDLPMSSSQQGQINFCPSTDGGKQFIIQFGIPTGVINGFNYDTATLNYPDVFTNAVFTISGVSYPVFSSVVFSARRDKITLTVSKTLPCFLNGSIGVGGGFYPYITATNTAGQTCDSPKIWFPYGYGLQQSNTTFTTCKCTTGVQVTGK